MSAPASIATEMVLEQSVLSASPEQLIDMVMDHVLLHLSLASASSSKAWAEVQSHLHKAQRGILVLQGSLALPGQRGQTGASQKFSADLKQLYSFMISSLVDADSRQDLSVIPGVLKVMGNISSGWKQGVMRQGA